MTGIESVVIKNVIVHRVGNPTRGEALKLSENPLTLNDELVRSMLLKYFLGAFNENDQYHFTHLSDVNLNEVFNYVTHVFEDSAIFVETSALIAGFLHAKSSHARIKEGEMYVAHFAEVPFGSETRQAIGIFKSENKENFLKVFQHGQSIEVISEEGVNISKPEKACLVFRENKEGGYVVCVLDNVNKQNDTRYWIDEFLQVTPNADSFHNTDKYLGLCKQFITNEYAEKFEVTKSDQIDLLNRSMDYFKTNDQFNLEEFSNEVMHHKEVIDTFIEYKKTYETVQNFAIEDEFDIHLSAVKRQERVFKSVLKLDKNFHVYIHGRKDLIEKGYDEMSGKHYYKLYFDEES